MKQLYELRQLDEPVFKQLEGLVEITAADYLDTKIEVARLFVASVFGKNEYLLESVWHDGAFWRWYDAVWIENADSLIGILTDWAKLREYTVWLEQMFSLVTETPIKERFYEQYFMSQFSELQRLAIHN
jgi:hypothetical protein